MSVKKTVLDRLTALAIPCEIYEHAPAYTMADCLALPYAAPDVTFCKNILLCNRQQTIFYLYVMAAEKQFRTADTSKALGCSRLSFAPEEALMSLLQTPSGSLSPFGLWFDAEHVVTPVFDLAVFDRARIAFHPCDNTATVVMATSVFRTRVIPALGKTPVYL